MDIVKYEVSGEMIELSDESVKALTGNNKYITKGEIELFVELCKYQKLNPFIREAYLIKYEQEKPAQMVTSYSAFMRIADEQSNFAGIKDGVIVLNKDNVIEREGCIVYPSETLIGGWAEVYRTDRQIPSVAKLNIKEYTTGKANWKNMPATMINKCAKVAALRKAFPKSFNSLYSSDELDREMNPGNISNNSNDDIVYDFQDFKTEDRIVMSDIIYEPEKTDYVMIDYQTYKDNADNYVLYKDEKGQTIYDKKTREIAVLKPKE